MSIRLGPTRGSLRVAHSLPRALPSFAYSIRGYASNSYPLFAFTWLTRSPDTITTQDILSSLPSSPTPLLAPNSVPLLLVTPSFAHWLDPSDKFLPQLMRQLHGNDSNTNSFYSVAAVVDKIPESSALNKLESEGLSLLAIGKENVHVKAVPPRRFGRPASEESDILVSIKKEQTSQSPTGVTHEIGLRLANTVFVNGKESTLLGMQWTRDGTTNAYTLDSTIDLTSCAVTSTSSAGASPNLELPLYPIGERRKVIASMGNILRQISKSSDPNSQEPIPASSELEKDLPRYIKEYNITDQRVSVWALVENPDIQVGDHSLPTRDYLIQSLRQGGKLHRVVSGGGGWGKKQGLLSLDPEISFSGSVQRDALIGLDQLFNPSAKVETDQQPFHANSLVGDDLSLLSQVATSGDFIQFFVSVDPTSMPDAVPSDACLSEGNITYRFGMLSNAEERSSLEIMDGNDNITVVPNSFGALSEKAISYTQPMARGGETPGSSTKLDIPGCRVVLDSV
ncbi:hypothetical protein PMG11_02507 [Penicillium brasilianum]|uniref:V-type ATPase n=1 Tax=Penicillium brasilianum TaxID=104259 RepID=A0A0F7TK60_PENBI|nr:hypothetical protein PMG11_02507 [Penicillium brasilianum]